MHAEASRASAGRGGRIAFWVFAGIGLLVMPSAWVWYGISQVEAQSEQGRALAAGTTMEGFAEVVGGVPLVLTHVIGLALLLPLGWRAWRGVGIATGLVAVAVASAVGIGVAQLLWDGGLFDLSIGRGEWVP